MAAGTDVLAEGSVYDSVTGGPRLRLRNATGAVQRVRIASAAFPEGFKPARGYRPAAPEALEFPEGEIEVAAGQVRDVDFRLRVPTEGPRRSAFLVRGESEGGPALGQILIESAPEASAGRRP